MKKSELSTASAKSSSKRLAAPARAKRSAKTGGVTIETADESASLVQQTVAKLRQQILARPDEEAFLGSEEQLMSSLGVSRPTFRQAARLLEHEQLLKIKRGIGGGFFARPPSAEAVSRMASIFLNSQGTSLRQINDACAPLVIEAARLAAGNPDNKVRRKLREFVQLHKGFEQKDDFREAARLLLEFEQLLAQLSGNPAVELMINVMRHILRSPRHGYFHLERQHAKVYADYMNRIAEAVEVGDTDMALLVTRRFMAEIEAWLP